MTWMILGSPVDIMGKNMKKTTGFWGFCRFSLNPTHWIEQNPGGEASRALSAMKRLDSATKMALPSQVATKVENVGGWTGTNGSQNWSSLDQRVWTCYEHLWKLQFSIFFILLEVNRSTILHSTHVMIPSLGLQGKSAGNHYVCPLCLGVFGWQENTVLKETGLSWWWSFIAPSKAWSPWFSGCSDYHWFHKSQLGDFSKGIQDGDQGLCRHSVGRSPRWLRSGG